MTILKIGKDKKHLSKLELDDGRIVFIDNDTVIQYCLKNGSELSEERLSEIIGQSDFSRAKSRALWYLDRSDYTEKALYDKLIKAGFTPEISASVMARICELGLIDDRRYAFTRADKYINSDISRREAYMKLVMKGISKELATEAIESVDKDEHSQIHSIIEKKYSAKLSDKENIPKVYAALIRKGFSFGAVKDALKAYCQELEYTGEE